MADSNSTGAGMGNLDENANLGRTGTPDNPVGDAVGEAAGGISGALTGAAIGAPGGPVGAIIGGIAGALGGWWAGREVSHAATRFTHHDDTFYRDHYERSDAKLADRSYEDVRPAYQLGHVAATNPDYRGKPFDHVEPDLRRGWDTTAAKAHGEWDQVRNYARDAYTRNTNASPESAEGTLNDPTTAADQADKRIDDTAGNRGW